MKKCLVTVGTSSFDSLLKELDSLRIDSLDIYFQTGTSKYKPKNYQHSPFIDNFNDSLREYDLIISHAGAGSVYHMLECNYNIIVVPNTDRVDLHQLELAKFVESNNLALTCHDISEIKTKIEVALTHPKFDKYTKEEFFKFSEIINFLK
ncbi:PssE/Cps14G family polysaccharide biosynthesis glycosyltransferase [Photobacterium rosenbergii]|uniref:PssE/Cps14G family polysaccharide biosynthesis glycosyltransferase n=1 Tax=Photobacterium rosenbergii TaxID=294936 RepID=A0ABU3ZPT1_9GAMM|nr:PssE/Cps14G family polysaccharide biosynthesis glycosyltransferase [Photobacterium rosenbergii]MDV5172112.1 PssE/Cps14G family polysaccharide biosynthesis glycosyltransferase [Photobacterium rosenbergii]